MSEWYELAIQECNKPIEIDVSKAELKDEKGELIQTLPIMSVSSNEYFELSKNEELKRLNPEASQQKLAFLMAWKHFEKADRKLTSTIWFKMPFQTQAKLAICVNESIGLGLSEEQESAIKKKLN